MTESLTHAELLACLEWQIDLGVDETLCETPVDRYALAAKPPAVKPASVAQTAVVAEPETDPVAAAEEAARAAPDIGALRDAMAAFELCDLRKGAKSLVFAEGTPGASVMILVDAPGREEDQTGLPVAGPAAQLLDKMLAAIGLSRSAQEPDRACYIASTFPWRPPQNREPTSAELAMMLPFLQRHIELAQPRALVLMGNTPCTMLLKERGIAKLRGHWSQVHGVPALPMLPPSYLMRQPLAKRQAWADLLALHAHLKD